MNELEKYFNQNKGRLIHKWVHYFDIYSRHFSKFKDKEITILEIGVSQGGSLQMWKSYFGKNAKIYGIDIDPRCKEFEEENIEIFIGSQSDKEFLKRIKAIIPPIDILVDDGGHTMQQQIISYEELFDHIKENGVYLIEDLHTSYWDEFGGGYLRESTFIEYSKHFIDSLNAHYSKSDKLKVNNFTESVDSIHYYDSVLVIEKKKKGKNHHSVTGNRIFNAFDQLKYPKTIENILKQYPQNSSLYFIAHLIENESQFDEFTFKNLKVKYSTDKEKFFISRILEHSIEAKDLEMTSTYLMILCFLTNEKDHPYFYSTKSKAYSLLKKWDDLEELIRFNVMLLGKNISNCSTLFICLLKSNKYFDCIEILDWLILNDTNSNQWGIKKMVILDAIKIQSKNK